MPVCFQRSFAWMNGLTNSIRLARERFQLPARRCDETDITSAPGLRPIGAVDHSFVGRAIRGKNSAGLKILL